jgi:2-amino-4-hydroxy-6-hydroxymethyldihydropteridine diphosphokinase
MKHSVYLGLGSNQGDRAQLIAEAIRLIDQRVGSVVRQSSLIETEPWGFESANKFLNGVVCCETEKTPREVLVLTQQIERDLGRNKKVNCKSSNRKYADRPIDIDILLYDNLTINEPDLQIPHPLMQQRDFVMIPLREINNNLTKQDCL